MSGNLTTSLLQGALAKGFASRVALREPKRVWSYETLADEAGRAAAALHQIGVRAGETVALVLHDSMELAAALFGAMHLGAIAVPVSILLRPAELRALLNDCGAAVVVVAADLAATIELVRPQVATLRGVLAVGGARAGQHDYHALTRAVEQVPPAVDVDDEAPAFVLYSAGASKTPRGVAHGRRAVESACAAYAREVLELGQEDRVFSSAKLSSAYGLGLGLLFPIACGASTFLLPARPRPRTLFDVMAAFRPTVFAATPSLYAQMVQDYGALSGARPRCFQTVRHAISGAEGLPAPLARKIHETFGIAPLHGFGVTEALHFVLTNRPGEMRSASVGLPLSGIEARIVDEAGQPLGAEQMGLLELRGPTVARGYFRGQGPPVTPEPAADTPTMRVLGDGWVRLGDRFLIDREGHYYHCGRTDELFKVGGRWVAPSEVEQTLLGHPAVGECAVIEGADEHGLPQPHAFVVPNAGHKPSPRLSVALMEYVKTEIAPYKYPRVIQFVDALPKDTEGRVERSRLQPSATPPRA